MIKHYCRTCATMEHVQGYKWQGGTVYLCDDCKRDYWQDIVSDMSENGKACVNVCKGNSRTLDANLGRERGMYDVGDRSMSKKEIYEQVVRLVAEQLDMTPDEIDPDVKLAELGFDSLAAAEFAVAMDEPFGIEITDEEMWSGMFASMTTNDVVEYILKRRDDDV